jgi:hypothetical protein
MAFFVLALLFAVNAESTTTTALPTADMQEERMLQNATNTTPSPTPSPTPMPTPSPTPAPTPTPLPPVEVAVAYKLDEASFTALTEQPQEEVFASFEASFAEATGIDPDAVTVTEMTVGGEPVDFTGRRLDSLDLEVTYEIAVANETASIQQASDIASDIASFQQALVDALVAEVEDSFEIEGMTVEVVPAFEPDTPKKKKETVESGAYLAFAAMATLLC